MTMHMIQGVRSQPSKKPKAKMTNSNLTKWREELIAYNKRAKRQGDQQLTLEQYIDYKHGKGLPKSSNEDNISTFSYNLGSNRRITREVKSLDTGVGNALATPRKEYTGTLVKGIAQTHKSNAVPVINNQEAIDIARMRR